MRSPDWSPWTGTNAERRLLQNAEQGRNAMPDNLPAEHDHVSVFEKIRRVNDAGNEYWSPRDLAGMLGYGQYSNFEPVIERAKTACFNSGQRVEDHFADMRKMIEIGKGGTRAVSDIYLSRYACYPKFPSKTEICDFLEIFCPIFPVRLHPHSGWPQEAPHRGALKFGYLKA
jgi:DNA-directed RNA polymerase subunit N (RpoN/RPB10)